MSRNKDRRRSGVRRRAALAASLALLAGLSTGAQAEKESQHLSPDQFGYGSDLSFEETGALQTAILPIAVYRSSVEPGLADLRVFNAAGEVVPHAIRILGGAEPDSVFSEPLPLYRLPDDPADDAEIIAYGSKREIRMEARVSEDESSINIETRPPAAGTDGEAPVRGYLIDADDLPRAVVGLELELAPSDHPFLASLRVRSSDDLQRYSTRAGTTRIARLEQSGHSLEIDRLSFAGTRQRYLELTLPGKPLPIQILSVRAQLAPKSPQAARLHAKLKGTKLEGEADAILYDAGGEIPVDRVQVDLPRRDSVVEAQLSTARSSEGPWHTHFSGLLYDLEHDGRTRNPPLSKRRSDDRYFKLVISPKGGGAGPRPPTLDIAWRPAQLLFVARGEGPFTLAYGRAGAEASTFDASTLLALTKTKEADLPRASAGLGSERQLAGASVLEEPPEPIETRVFLLWGVLIVAVALLVTFSVRLLREVRG